MKTMKIVLGVTLIALSAGALAQTMVKKKYDQACLDRAGVKYIGCMKDARSESAKQACETQKNEDTKKCKIA